jgi:hypothetical protein
MGACAQRTGRYGLTSRCGGGDSQRGGHECSADGWSVGAVRLLASTGGTLDGV